MTHRVSHGHGSSDLGKRGEKEKKGPGLNHESSSFFNIWIEGEGTKKEREG